MNETREIKIKINAENPVEYLACCGIFEIAARIDKIAEACWTQTAPTEFILTTVCDEEDLTHCIVQTFIGERNWTFQKHPKSKEVVSISVDFPHDDGKIRFDLDWWYNSLTREGNVNEEKTLWKMYTAKVTTESAYRDLRIACQRTINDGEPESLTKLLQSFAVMEKGEKGRFGFDPRSSRGELDVGYSVDGLNEPTNTFAFAEMLAMIGVAGFFPSRTVKNKFDASRSWDDDGFNYRLWHFSSPISLARVHAATNSIAEKESFSAFQAKRALRGLGFYNFLLSTPKN